MNAELLELVNQSMVEQDLRQELAKLGIGTDGEKAIFVERLTQAQKQQEDLGVVEDEVEEGDNTTAPDPPEEKPHNFMRCKCKSCWDAF